MERMSRLPGRSIKHFGWSAQLHQVWMAESHLLCREISGYREDVKRYNYKDIQAIVCTPTSSWRTCNWIAGLFLAFLAAVGLIAAYTGSLVTFVLAWTVATVVLVILLGNLVLGATCATTLYTAAAEAPLYSLGRRRSAEKAIARICTFVNAAQRDLAPPEPGESGPSGLSPQDYRG